MDYSSDFGRSDWSNLSLLPLSKKAKPLITIPALAPTVVTTPSWLEALKGFISPTPTVTQAVSVAPTPSYQAPAPTYKAPAPTYKAPAPNNGEEPAETPKYEPTWWGIPGGGVPSK